MLILSHHAYALDLKNVVAYPVPFNPNKGTLIIGDPANTTYLNSHKIKLAIFDINGDLVIEKAVSGVAVVWNGRNGAGRFVKPGLYIIKVEVDDDDGDYGKKVIRILVNY